MVSLTVNDHLVGARYCLNNFKPSYQLLRINYSILKKRKLRFKRLNDQSRVRQLLSSTGGFEPQIFSEHVLILLFLLFLLNLLILRYLREGGFKGLKSQRDLGHFIDWSCCCQEKTWAEHRLINHYCWLLMGSSNMRECCKIANVYFYNSSLFSVLSLACHFHHRPSRTSLFFMFAFENVHRSAGT